MLPLSSINALRRAAISGLTEAVCQTPVLASPISYQAQKPNTTRSFTPCRSACFTTAAQLTPAAQNYFDLCYLPAEQLLSLPDDQLSVLSSKTEIGVVLPPVIMDHERAKVASLLSRLFERGIRSALVSNLSHLSLVTCVGMIPHGDFRFNVTNTESVRILEQLGVIAPILSPELSLPQIRDISGNIRTIVYGRIPLMLLEKCVIREISDCKTCDAGRAELIDRRGMVFPVLRTPDHRNVIYNSVPTYMADAQDQLIRYRTGGWHFIFSTETPREVDDVVDAYRTGKSASHPIRRINK